MNLAIIEVIYKNEVVGLSKSRGDFFIREENFSIKDRSPYFAIEDNKIEVLGFGPQGGEKLLREFLALGAEKAFYLTVPFYGIKNFDLYPVAKYIADRFKEHRIYTSNEEMFYRLKNLNVILVKEKIEGRLPSAIEIVKARRKTLELIKDFNYATAFNYIGGEIAEL